MGETWHGWDATILEAMGWAAGPLPNGRLGVACCTGRQALPGRWDERLIAHSCGRPDPGHKQLDTPSRGHPGAHGQGKLGIYSPCYVWAYMKGSWWGKSKSSGCELPELVRVVVKLGWWLSHHDPRDRDTM